MLTALVAHRQAPGLSHCTIGFRCFCRRVGYARGVAFWGNIMRILLAGIAAGVAMFIWSAIAHVATPLGTIGISTLPDESVTVGNLASAIGDKGGLYLFPMPSGTSGPSTSAATAPGGFLVFNPRVATTMAPKNLVIEFLTELAEGLIAAWLLAQTAIV